MSVESDGVGESFDEQMRMVTMAAMQVGQRVSQQRADSMRQAQQESQQQAQQLQQRMEAERRVAVVELSVVQNSEWWRDAGPQEVADKYATAHAWKDESPEVARHEERMRQELKDRYGIDPSRDDGQGIDAERLREEIRRVEERLGDPERAEAAQAESLSDAAQQRGRENDNRATIETDPQEEQRLRADAERERNQSVRHSGEAVTAYDSADRRDATAEKMRSAGGNPEQINTAMRADQAQGAPAHEAVSNPPGKRAVQPQANRSVNRTRGQQRVR